MMNDNLKRGRRFRLAVGVVLLGLVALFYPHNNPYYLTRPVPPQCLALRNSPEPTANFIASRTTQGSDRFVEGTPPVLIRNAKILTAARNGTEIVFGDILLDKGVVQGVGYIPNALTQNRPNLHVVDAAGKWVSPGIVDLHSHLAVYSAPDLEGASDGNSGNGPILPWLRSIDGLNTHDDAFRLAIAGGVTTAQILPGSANNIGGQAFLIKPRPTSERSASAMLLEPPLTLGLNTSDTRPKWRHMKHACGENPSRTYSQNRMDSAWAFRDAYETARKIRDAQDDFCRRAEMGMWDGKEEFPENLQREALVDVLRGRVKLSVHCYEAVDLDQIVRLSNEFKFPVASFHHAGETYLVPELLKKAWGGIPTIALFASNFRKKREAYRGSEFAPRILTDNGIPAAMKSDHPVINSRHLMYEAQQAHYYGLNPALALASVTSTPAKALGVGWRVGTLATGFDADLVIWDSHPLALGATPVQVYIDGIPQLDKPATLHKPHAFQDVPQTPSWEEEIKKTIEYEGLPPLEGRKEKGVVMFVNVLRVETTEAGVWGGQHDGGEGGSLRVVVDGGAVRCVAREEVWMDEEAGCGFSLDGADAVVTVDLKGGELAPGLTTFGSDLGLSEIMLEASTTDGRVFDPLTMHVPKILKDTVVRAVDGLQFGGRNTLLAYRAGVTTAVVAPMGYDFMRGVGTAFATGASGALASNAIVQAETAMHIAIHPSMVASVSTQIGTLRKLLLVDDSEGPWRRVRNGEIPLVVAVHSADIMATLLRLKTEFERARFTALRLTFAGATEAHLLAAEIGAAGVSVVLSPARPYPEQWDRRRILPGPPLSRKTSVITLLEHGVNVALGVASDYDARNARFEIAWAALDADGAIDYPTAMALSTKNLHKALGLDGRALVDEKEELVVLQGGGMFDFDSKVVGVVSRRRGVVDLF